LFLGKIEGRPPGGEEEIFRRNEVCFVRRKRKK
jgi:hypothetical protein